MKGYRKASSKSPPKKATSKAIAAPVAPPPSVTPEERKLIVESTARVAARKTRIQGKVAESSATSLAMGADHDDQRGWNQRLLDAMGTTSLSFAMDILANTICVEARPGEINDRILNKTLAVFDGSETRDEIETMLISQMIATHEASFEMLRRARWSDRIDFLTQYGSLATKLQRTFIAQIEALAKLRRGGEQVVRVVHVHQGAQAIIGDVTHAGGREGSHAKIGSQPHAIGDSSILSLLGENPERDAVPSASNEERPLPNARRKEHRPTERKSERIQTR